MKYGHLVLYGLLLAAVYGFVRPGSPAGRAVTSVTESLSGVLGKGLTTIGGAT
jgi:hypothetical protein